MMPGDPVSASEAMKSTPPINMPGCSNRAQALLPVGVWFAQMALQLSLSWCAVEGDVICCSDSKPDRGQRRNPGAYGRHKDCCAEKLRSDVHQRQHTGAGKWRGDEVQSIAAAPAQFQQRYRCRWRSSMPRPTKPNHCE